MENVAYYVFLITLLSLLFFSKDIWLNIFILLCVWCAYYIKDDAGVDTYVYKIRYQSIENGFLSIENGFLLLYEPLLNLIMYLFKWLGFSWDGFIATYSVIYLVLLKKSLRAIKSHNSNLLFLFLYIGIDSTFNGLRIGLAIVLFLLTKNSLLKYVSILAHSTFLLVIIREYLFLMIPFLVFVDLVELPEIITHKFIHYGTAVTSSTYSGVVIFVVILFLRLGVKDSFMSRLRSVSFYLISVAAFFGNVWFVRAMFLEFYYLVLRKEQRFGASLMSVTGVLFFNFLRQIFVSFNNVHGWAVFK